MFVILREYGYVHHIVCSAYKARFITLQQYGYVPHIICLAYKDRFVTSYVQCIRLGSSDCDNMVMFVTLQGRG
jgi:hypothetical protein